MILHANFTHNQNEVTTDELFQWDTGQQLCIEGLTGIDASTEVHFANNRMIQAIVKTGTFENDKLTVDIPNEFLQSGGIMHGKAWIYVTESNAVGRTIKTIKIPIVPRKRPNDYVSPADPDSKGIVERALEILKDGTKVSYITTEAVDNATETGKIYRTTVGSSKALIIPVSGTLSQVQFRLDRDGKIYSRRRSRLTTESPFPAWGSWTDISAAVDPAVIRQIIEAYIEEHGIADDKISVSMLDVKSYLNFEIGGIDNSGLDTNQQNRIRSEMRSFPFDVTVYHNSKTRFAVFYYKEDRKFDKVEWYEDTTSAEIPAETLFRIISCKRYSFDDISDTVDYCVEYNNIFVYRTDGLYKTIIDNSSAISQLETDVDTLENNVGVIGEKCDMIPQSAISMLDLKSYLQFEIGGLYDNGSDYNNPDGSPNQHDRIRSKMMTLPYDIIVKQSANHRFRVFKFDSQTEALVSDSGFMIGADKTVTITSGTLFRILADNNDLQPIPNDDLINSGAFNKLFVYRSDEAGMHTRIERVEYQALANAAAITELSEEKVPMYWKATIDSKVARIRKIMEDAAKLGQRVSTFVLSTDNHYPSHSDVSPILMKYLSENCSISTAINIGDIIEDDGLDITGDRAAESKQLGLNNELYITKRLSSPFKIYLPVQGNHDDNCCLVRGQTPDNKDARFPARIIYNAEWAQMIQGQFSHYDNVEFGKSGKYFAYADKMNKLVYIGLDSMASDNHTTLSKQYGTVNVRSTQFGTDQINWLSNTLNNIPSGYGVIIFTHISPHIFLDNNGVAVAGQGTPKDGDSVKALVRSFVNNGGELVGFFTGHFHFDAVNSADGVTYICTMNDGLYTGSNKTGGTAGIGFPDGKARGTVTECAFDVVMVNRSKHHVDIVRVGCGSDERSYNYVVEGRYVFGVMWDYSLSSPQLTRLTPQTDPLGVVTNAPSQEPTTCVGNDGSGQSDFNNYMPWAGMQRYNYVNGQIVDFVDYTNGETFVYIPEFWSKIVDDSANSKMYIYISDSELEGFAKHPGSGRYMSRYECNNDFLSAPGTKPKVNTNLTNFRSSITAIDNKHFQYDIHTYNALELLYIVEFANLNSQAKIGVGITSGGKALNVGETDILTYHTGRVEGTSDNVSAVQYRWIENLWGNVWNWVDGVLIQDGLVYICNDVTKYSSTITNDYISTELTTPTNSGCHKTDNNYNNCYLIPATTGGSNSTYTCDYYYYYDAGLCGLSVGGSCNDDFLVGLFSWAGDHASDSISARFGGRSILVIGGDS